MKKDPMNNREVKEDSFFKYTFLVSLNIIAGLVFGKLTDKFSAYIEEKYYFINIYGQLIIQIIIVSLGISIMKKIARYLPQEPQPSYSYDVIFIAVYLGSQYKLRQLINKILDSKL